MPEAVEKQSRKQFVIAQLERVGRDQYSAESVEGCLNVIRPALMEISSGLVIFSQVEKLVRAQNGDRAIKLVQAAPFRSKHLTTIFAMAGLIIAAVVAVLVFVLGKGGS